MAESSESWRRGPAYETIVVEDPYENYCRNPTGNIVGKRPLRIKQIASNTKIQGQAWTTRSEVNVFQGGFLPKKAQSDDEL